MIQKWFRRMILVRKALVCINISRLICRSLKRFGFHFFCRRKSAVNIQTLYRGYVNKKRVIAIRKQKSSSHMMCQTLCRALSRHGFRSLCRWKASIKLQNVCRGFVARKRLISSRKQQLGIRTICEIL